MAALKHSVSLPSGISASGVLIHRVSKVDEDKFFESEDNGGEFAAGKSLEIKTTLEISGDLESTSTLPAAGSGDNSSSSPKVDKVSVVDLNNKAAEFTIEARYVSAGAGDYPSAPPAP